MKNHSLVLFTFLLMCSITFYGQSQNNGVSISNKSQTSLDLQRSIILENDSESKEVIINISENTIRFDLIISTSVSGGQLLIEFYSPDNKKQGNFTVGTQLNSIKREMAKGTIRKSLNEPQAGQWKIQIIPTEASGEIEIQARTEN
ncbi:hypothetical protein [uncultured Marivirga sp.]|uniref:hypothetical protein n=1 Tax=uncultured Marivirga sp. TaxID=1123707 RepID=UPI0030EDAB3A